MQFLYPSFLFALFAIAIPIIIHLFNFRKYKTVYFSNVRFLKEVKEETQSRSKLKHLLVLIARILSITFLVFAFAQPFIPETTQKIIVGDKAVSIYIDNSFSMGAIAANGTMLDEAKKTAALIVKNNSASTRYQLLTNNFEAKQQRLLSKEEFINALDEITLSGNYRNVKQVTARQSNALNNSGAKNKQAYLLSDFQKTFFNALDFSADTTIAFRMLPIQTETKANVFIDSCWFETPVRRVNQVERLHVRIKNTGTDKLENQSVRLFINGEQKTPASYSINANAVIDTVLTFKLNTAGIKQCKIEIADYPITFDDSFFFTYTIFPKIKVLCVNDKNRMDTKSNYIQTLFANDSLVHFTQVDEKTIDYSTLQNFNSIIINELSILSSGLVQELNKYTAAGGSLLIIPSAQLDIKSYASFLNLTAPGTRYGTLDTNNIRIGYINYDANIYKNVFEKKQNNIDLPLVFNHYAINTTTKANNEVLLKLQNGDVFLSKTKNKNGFVYLLASALQNDWSNFPKHAIFVPTLYQLVLNSVNQHQLQYTIGNDEAIIVNDFSAAGDRIYKMQLADKKIEFIPEAQSIENTTKLFVHEQVSEPGTYMIVKDNESIQAAAFNYNRQESDMQLLNKNDLQNWIDKNGGLNFSLIDANINGTGNSIGELSEGKKLWKLCIILVLVFIAIEIALLRLLK